MFETIRNLQIYYEIHGEGRPVLFIHGYPIDHTCMTGCMEPFFSKRGGYKRIYLDLPGMGRSGGSEEIQTADDMVDVVHRLTEKLIPGENYLLAGYSYGGYLARGLVYKYAEEIDGLFFICPVVIPDKRLRDLPATAVFCRDEAFLARLRPEEAREFAGMAVIQTESIYERCRKEISGPLSRADRKFTGRFVREGYGFTFPVDTAAPFEKPVLILAGRQDSVVGYRDFWPLLENYPRATFAVLDRAGHNLQIEQEGMFAFHLADWLDRVEEEPCE